MVANCRWRHKMSIRNECRFNASFLTFPSTFSLCLHVTVYGVTRVGVTRDCNWGCHPNFSEKNLQPFLVITVCLSVLQCHPYLFFFWKTDDLFCSSLELLLISVGCHPAGGCPPVQPRLSSILCKFTQKWFFSFGCYPLEGVTRGGPPPPPLPHSDVTAR